MYYEKSSYGGISLLIQCNHESGDNEFTNMVIDMKSFKYISYEIGRGKKARRYNW